MIKNDIAINKEYTSLSRGLVIWFLLLSLLPISLISWISYQEANNSLTESATHKLEQSAKLNINFIQNWFDYRFMDLKTQSESYNNIQLLKTLREGFHKSNKSLAEYVQSDDWSKRIDASQNSLISLSKDYDYIYDLFLIDIDGNLLYTVAQEADLGTNLFSGPYSDTLFSQSVKTSLSSGESRFSDLQHYAPSNNKLSSFLTAPLVNKSGVTIGVFAIHLHLDRIINTLQQDQKTDQTLKHYLVGDDGKLRTGISKSENEILNRTIDTIQFKTWHAEHKNPDAILNDQEEIAFIYDGPNNKPVLGIHSDLRLSGINWVLISEIDLSEALAPAIWLGKVILLLVFMTFSLVVSLAIYQAQRISKPLIKLANASMLVAAGKTGQQVEVTSKNEIGKLANAFNHMLRMRQIHEQALEHTNQQAEQALSELAEQKFALDQHAIVAITDIQGTITFINEKFTEISGYSRKELIGNNHRMLNSGYHTKDFFHGMYQTIANGKVWNSEICNRAKDGQIYWVDTTIVPFKDKKGKPKSYIAIRTDITERKKTELDLLKAKDDAEEATRLKSDFLANMSHEIRTPMNGVIGMTGLILDTDLTSKQRDYAKSTMKSAEALLTIINDILDFSKIEAGKLELEAVPFDLQNLSEDVSEIMAIKCREKNIELLLRYIPNTARHVVGDPGRVRQILLNLLSNAIKFTERGNVILTVESFDMDNGQLTIHIKVEDSGIGIERDKLKKIFNKFDQADGSTTRKFGGTGLGLAICQQLCRMMDGDILVTSEKNKGSTFSFAIILGVTEQNSFRSPKLENQNLLTGLKTLIVDDLPMARTILTEQVSGLNLQSETASSGKEAISKLTQAIIDQNPFDIVITDFNMPEMDGEMLASKIKELKLLQKGALLFVTSSPRKGDCIRLKEMGVDGYLTKPTHPSELPKILTLIWRAKQQNKEIPLVTRHTILEAESGQKDKIILRNTHILLVEDNPVNQMVATEYLERYGCTITPAGNGLEAVSQIKETRFNLIFMDCQMPEMDGFEATGEIRQWENKNNIKHTPIIAFTANAMQGDKEKCLSAGMDDYISKPVSENALENILKKWLKNKIQKHQKNTDSTIEEIEIENSSDFEFDTFYKLKELFGDKFPDAVNQHTENAENNIDNATKAIENKKSKELERCAHSIKGASAQFGAIKFSQLAEKMEAYGKAEDFEKARSLFAQLKKAQQDARDIMLKHIQ